MKEIKKYQEIKKTLANRIYRSMNFEESESDASESENCQIPSLDSIETNCIWAVLSCDNCPNIRDEDIINYFIYNKIPVSGKPKRCHRQIKKSKKFCSDNFLSDIYVTQVNDSPYCFVKAKSRPSMKQHVLWSMVIYLLLSIHYTLF